MRTLSLPEFKNLCDELSPAKYIFSTENQKWHLTESTLSMGLQFKIILIALNPNTIRFSNDDSYMQLRRVKYIKLWDEKSLLGTVFTIICGDLTDPKKDVQYVVIAQ